MSFYWITRLDAINAFVIIFGILLLFFGILLAFMYAGEYFDLSRYNYEEGYIRKIKSIMRTALSTIILGVLFITSAVFIPTTKEACAIYVVDYLQDNEKAQQLPDKVINALDAYLTDISNSE